LVGILPAGVEVIRAEINRVPEPECEDFVVMTPLFLERMATNLTTYSDPFPQPGGVQMIAQATEATVQVDVHGPNSSDNVQIIQIMFRDQYAVAAMASSGFDIAPLYTGSARQSPFKNGEDQIEFSWTIDLVMQTTPVVTISQDFASNPGQTILNPVDIITEALD
jgi:hypothetical protein